MMVEHVQRLVPRERRTLTSHRDAVQPLRVFLWGAAVDLADSAVATSGCDCGSHIPSVYASDVLRSSFTLELNAALETIDGDSRRAHRERAAEACEKASVRTDIRRSVSLVLMSGDACL